MNYIELYGHKYYYLEDDIQRPYTRDVELINDQWRIKGKLIHREDGPAIEYADGSMNYLQYGKPHRIGGPACQDKNGIEYYYENGKLHREDGPAIERAEYYFAGKKFSSKEEWEHYKTYLVALI